MKLLLSLFLMAAAVTLSAGNIKYVFVLIGDGFGPSQRAMTEAALGGKLVMNTFPYSLRNGTNTFDNRTTDSAASGTAIACGIKTHYYAIGVDKDDKPVESLASALKREKNFRIGIISSCGLTDATPASQYAHQKARDMYKQIVEDMTKSNFDFFAGSDIRGCNLAENRNPDKISKEEKKYRKQLADAGYTILAGEDMQIKLKTSDPAKKTYAACQPYTEWNLKKEEHSFFCSLFCFCEEPDQVAIPSLADYLTSAAERFAPQPFFIMMECGKIDHAGHNNDAAWTVREVKAFDDAVAAAVKFAEKHPEETLIIVTADHETGGLKITDEAKMKENAKLLLNQKVPLHNAVEDIRKMIHEKKSTGDILSAIEDVLGYDDFTKDEKEMLKGLLDTNYVVSKARIRRFSAADVLKKASAIRDQKLGVKYTSGGHTPEKVITNIRIQEKTAPAGVIKENSDIRKFIESTLAK